MLISIFKKEEKEKEEKEESLIRRSS